MPDPKQLTAAGGVVWRDGRDGPEVLLVHRPGLDDWSLPKGKPDPGENGIGTAVREVTEETGLRFTLGARLGTVSYEVKGGTKTVTYWAMRLRSDQSADPKPHDGEEIDDLAWHSIGSARETLTYPADERILRAFVDRGTAPVTLILVRHARAGKRREWPGPDAARPLDELGRAQAGAIGGSLGAFGPTRLVAAPLARCIQTVEPLARVTGLPIEQMPTVADKALKRRAKNAVGRLCRWASGADETIVAVSQGDVIGAALHELLAPARGEHPRRKGSAWVFCARGGQIVAADYYPSLLPDKED